MRLLTSMALAALISLTSGCAFIDGISGSGDCDTPSGDCDEGDTCSFPHSLGSPPIDENDLDNCGRNRDFFLGLCDSNASGEDVVFEFFVERSEMYTICSSATSGSDFFVSDSCEAPNALACLEVFGGCVDLFLPIGPHFVFWQGGTTGDCTFVSLQIFSTDTPPMSESGAACLDGVDNDGNDKIDCEDSSCTFDPICNGVGVCEFANDGDCRCLGDFGCDGIRSDFICHDLAGPGPEGGSCGSNCNVNDWCGNFGLFCGPDGRCFDPGMGLTSQL